MLRHVPSVPVLLPLFPMVKAFWCCVVGIHEEHEYKTECSQAVDGKPWKSWSSLIYRSILKTAERLLVPLEAKEWVAACFPAGKKVRQWMPTYGIRWYVVYWSGTSSTLKRRLRGRLVVHEEGGLAWGLFATTNVFHRRSWAMTHTYSERGKSAILQHKQVWNIKERKSESSHLLGQSGTYVGIFESGWTTTDFTPAYSTFWEKRPPFRFYKQAGQNVSKEDQQLSFSNLKFWPKIITVLNEIHLAYGSKYAWRRIPSGLKLD